MTTDLAGGQVIIELLYLIASVLFILSLKWMSSPTTARHGIWAGEIGMLLAICGTLLHHGIVDYKLIFIALVLGTIIGVPLGEVAMTAVPQRTALSHAFGALCVTLVGSAEFYLRAPDISRFMMAVLSLEVILGGLTVTGSLMAAGKLQEILPQRPPWEKKPDPFAARPRKKPQRSSPPRTGSSWFPDTAWQWPRLSTKSANSTML